MASYPKVPAQLVNLQPDDGPPMPDKARRKEKEKQISLHLNVLSRMATGRDIDISLVDNGQGTFCDVKAQKIQVEDVSDDIDILIGLGFHELGHALATTNIDYEREGVPKDDIQLVHNQLNSLEDYRIENRIAHLYPPSEYYLRKMARWWRLEGSKKREIGEMVANPSFPLHLLLDNIDLSKFIQKAPRDEIRKIAAELKAARFDESPSTRALFPIARDVYYRLKPFFPPDVLHDSQKQEEFGMNMPIVGIDEKLTEDGEPTDKSGRLRARPSMDGHATEENKIFEVIGDTPATKKEEEPKGELATKMDFLDKLDKKSDSDKKDEGKLPAGSKPPTPKQQNDYVRPHEPQVIRVSSLDNPENSLTPLLIADEQYCSDQGRILGRKLIQELKFKDGTKHQLDDGELNVEDVIQNMQEHRGKLGSFNVFSDNSPLIHDHTVVILIDMSGSMEGADIENARGAALMLGKALEEMNVPYSIRGFGAKEGVLQIMDFVVKDFDEPLSRVKLGTMFMGHVNRDTDSIRNAMSVLDGQPGKKIIFVISDGHPNHHDGTSDYRDYNQNSFMDMWNLSRQAEKEGISIIGIGITKSAQDFISGAYLKGFSVDKIDELPERLLKIYLDETQELRQTWRKI